MYIRSVLIKDTTKEEREDIIRKSLDCGGGCENCSSCWLGGGSPWDMYQEYIDGKTYNERYFVPTATIGACDRSG